MSDKTFANLMGWIGIISLFVAIWTPPPWNFKLGMTGFMCIIILFLFVIGIPKEKDKE